MAEALFQIRVAQRLPPSNWRIASAGVWALEGRPAAQHAQTVMAERGLDIRQHRARSTDRELVRSFDLILTMEQGHREALRAAFPEIAGRVYLLSQVAGSSGNVADPIGGSLEEFRQVADAIDNLLEKGFEQIVELAQGQS